MSEQTTPTQSLGLIEVRGRIGAIEALDAALKAANVHFVNMSKVGGGLTAVFVEGEVGAVKAAVEAGAAAADRVSDLISAHVIPRPAAGIRCLTGDLPEQKPSSAETQPEKPSEENKKDNTKDNTTEDTVKKKEKPAKKPAEVTAAPEKPDFEQIKGYNVGKLRAFARSLEGFTMSRREINFAKRDALLERLALFLDGGSKA